MTTTSGVVMALSLKSNFLFFVLAALFVFYCVVQCAMFINLDFPGYLHVCLFFYPIAFLYFSIHC